MVINRKQHSSETRSRQAFREAFPSPNEIKASTPYDFSGKNLTPYGGLLPVATMLEKLGFQSLVERSLTIGRHTRVMSAYQFVLAMVLGAYVGFSRLYHLRFVARDPILAGILKVTHLPPQSTFWRFLASLNINTAQQILGVQRQMRERVWAAANVQLHTATLDTDTTVHTLYGKQMGGRKGYNPKNKGKKSADPTGGICPIVGPRIGANPGFVRRTNIRGRSIKSGKSIAVEIIEINVTCRLRLCFYCFIIKPC